MSQHDGPANLYDRLIVSLAGIAGLLIAAVCLVIVYDVVARNLGLQPPASTVALTEYSLLYFTMFAGPWLVRQRGHIVVEIVHARLPEHMRRIVDRLILVACAAIALVVAAIAAVLAVEAAARGEVEVRSLDAPRWALFGPMSAGFALMGVEFLRLLARGESVRPDGDNTGPGL